MDEMNSSCSGCGSDCDTQLIFSPFRHIIHFLSNKLSSIDLQTAVNNPFAGIFIEVVVVVVGPCPEQILGNLLKICLLKATGRPNNK